MDAVGLLLDDSGKMAVITGHLLLEAMLSELLVIKGRTGVDRLRFAQIVDEAVKLEVLDDHLAVPIRSLNRLRNNVAHELRYEVTHDQLFELTGEFAAAGIDFSDETIFENRELSAEWYGMAGCLLECVSNTYQHLAWIAHDMGNAEFLA